MFLYWAVSSSLVELLLQLDVRSCLLLLLATSRSDVLRRLRMLIIIEVASERPRESAAGGGIRLLVSYYLPLNEE